MTSKRRPDDTETNPNLSIWEIPVSELPDRAGEVWGRCPDKRQGNLTTDSTPRPKVKQIDRPRRSGDERAAATA